VRAQYERGCKITNSQMISAIKDAEKPEKAKLSVKRTMGEVKTKKGKKKKKRNQNQYPVRKTAICQESVH